MNQNSENKTFNHLIHNMIASMLDFDINQNNISINQGDYTIYISIEKNQDSN